MTGSSVARPRRRPADSATTVQLVLLVACVIVTIVTIIRLSENDPGDPEGAGLSELLGVITVGPGVLLFALLAAATGRARRGKRAFLIVVECVSLLVVVTGKLSPFVLLPWGIEPAAGFVYVVAAITVLLDRRQLS